jgi:hypothetical protein
VSNFFFVLGFLGTTVVCFLDCHFLGLTSWQGLNPFPWGLSACRRELLVLFTVALTSFYKKRFQESKG